MATVVTPIRRIRTGLPEVDRHFDSLASDLARMQARVDASITAAVAAIPAPSPDVDPTPGEILLFATNLVLDSSVATATARNSVLYTAAATPTGKNRINLTRWQVFVETLAANSGGALNANLGLGKTSGGSTLSGAGQVVYTLASALGDVQASVASTVDMPSGQGFEGFLDAGQSLWASLVVNYGTAITTPGAVRVCVWARNRP